MNHTTSIKPLKQDELRDLATCMGCKKKIGQTGCPIFHVVTIEQHCVDLKAVQRQANLEGLIGSPAIAAVMGPNEDFTRPLGERIRVMVCMDCSTSVNSATAILRENHFESAPPAVLAGPKGDEA